VTRTFEESAKVMKLIGELFAVLKIDTDEPVDVYVVGPLDSLVNAPVGVKLIELATVNVVDKNEVDCNLFVNTVQPAALIAKLF